MTDTDILIADRPVDGVARLTLNRPQSRNALSRALRDALVAQLAQLAEDPDIEAVVLTGNGDVFCAGFDLKELAQGDAESIFSDAQRYHKAVHNFPKPLIAAVNGPALAGGMDLALMCDIRLGAATARWRLQPVRRAEP